MISLSILTVLLLFPLALAQEPSSTTTPPRTTRPPIVSPLDPPLKGDIPVHTRFFAQIPDFEGVPSRIISIICFENDLYVCTETSGALIYKVTTNGSVSLFFDVADAVFAKTRRRIDFTNRAHGGLRSVAFHPDFKKNGLFYTSHIERRPRVNNTLTYLSEPDDTPIGADSVVAEFKYNFVGKRPRRFSYRQVLRVGLREFDHPIKQMAFYGPYLYIAHGDGSVQSAIFGGGQNSDGLGKILRIDPRRRGRMPYRIPPSNPFVGNPNMLDEVYALGFRNPHNLCFSRRGELYVAESGRDNIEEINIVKAGGNYGWSAREGTFVHLPIGGTLTGIEPLPARDRRFGFVYPNVQVPHIAPLGRSFVGQAIAGACPVENRSPLRGTYLYSNFPTSGILYYSFIREMRGAKVRRKPENLTQATVYEAKIFFDHDNLPITPPLEMKTLGDVLRFDPKYADAERVDVRFGRGKQGELYWSSKINGRIYVITSSVPGESV